MATPKLLLAAPIGASRCMQRDFLTHQKSDDLQSFSVDVSGHSVNEFIEHKSGDIVCFNYKSEDMKSGVSATAVDVVAEN